MAERQITQYTLTIAVSMAIMSILAAAGSTDNGVFASAIRNPVMSPIFLCSYE